MTGTDQKKSSEGEVPPTSDPKPNPPTPLKDDPKRSEEGENALPSPKRKKGSSKKLLLILLIYYLCYYTKSAQELAALLYSTFRDLARALYCVLHDSKKTVPTDHSLDSLDANFSALRRSPFAMKKVEVCLATGSQRVGIAKSAETNEWCGLNRGRALPDFTKILSLILELIKELTVSVWTVIHYFYSVVAVSLQVVYLTLSSYIVALIFVSALITLLPTAIRTFKRIISASSNPGMGFGNKKSSSGKIKVKTSSNASRIKGDRCSSYLEPPVSVSSLLMSLFGAFFEEDLTSDQGISDQKEKCVKPLVKFTLQDYKGGSEAKKELELILDFLKNPTKYHELGARLPRGVLLYGPPGTGKTLFARALAGEANVNFIHSCASEFRGSFVGSGARNIRSLFARARSFAPCILFIDEIDSISKRTSSEYYPYANQTINQILHEMDGFGKNESRVIVVGATNRLDNIDSALIRPGRFDKLVHVDLPDLQSRKDILEHYIGRLKKVGDVDSNIVARKTDEYSGAELEHLVNDASLLAVSEGAKQVEQKHLEGAIEKRKKSQEQVQKYDSVNYKQSNREAIAHMYN